MLREEVREVTALARWHLWDWCLECPPQVSVSSWRWQPQQDTGCERYLLSQAKSGGRVPGQPVVAEAVLNERKHSSLACVPPLAL